MLPSVVVVHEAALVYSVAATIALLALLYGFLNSGLLALSISIATTAASILALVFLSEHFINVVGVAVQSLLESVVPLQRDLNDDAIALIPYVAGGWV